MSAPIEISFQHKPPALSIVSVLIIAVVLIFLGLTLSRNSTFKTEISIWAVVAKRSPEKARPHNELGLALAKVRRFDASLIELEKARSLWPTNYRILTNLGNIYGIFGRDTEAIDVYKIVIKHKPEHTSARFNLAMLYMRRGMRSEAASEFEAILSVNPGDAEAAYMLRTIRGN